MRIVFSLLFSLFVPGVLLCQHTPAIINYKVADYKAHPQNWSVTQEKSGIMYFANTDGLLTFNGNAWSLYKSKNNKIIRSVCAQGDRIYTGAYGEFGYWTKNECGEMSYQSLLHLIKNSAIDKEEIWNIVSYGDKTYFQSFSVLMVYDGTKIEKVELPGTIMFMYNVGGKLIIQALEHGLFEIKEDNRAVMIQNTSVFKGKIVSGICTLPGKYKADLLISTNLHGIFSYRDGKVYKWKADLESYFAEIQINKLMVSQSGLLILGSIRDGVLIFDHNGQMLYHVNSSNGLLNNTILSMFEDKEENIWLGMDKGIGIVKMKDKILLYHDHSGILGTVYTTAEMDSILYIGTNQGLYYFDQREKFRPDKSTTFKLLKGTQGQVWQLKNLGSDLLCGHNEGTFIISKKNASKISDVTGGWYSEMTDSTHLLTILQGTYTGLSVLKKEDNKWKFSHKLEGYNEPVKKFISYKSGEIWVTGPNTGLSRLKVDKELKHIHQIYKYGSKDKIMDNANVDINYVNHKMLINDGQSHYYYDETGDTFIRDSFLNSFSPGYLIRIVDEQTWCRVYSDSLVIMRDSTALQTYKVGLNKDYHSVGKLSNGQLILSLNEGYAISKNYNTTDIPQMIEIRYGKIELLNSGLCISLNGNNMPEIAYASNNIRIHFYDCEFQNDKNYRYRLLPMDKEWKKANDISFLEFNNLNPGSYNVEIKREENGRITLLSFVILPPFYQSKWAWFLYLTLIVVGLYLSKKYFNKKLAHEKLKLESENQRLLREHKYQMENDRLVHDNFIKNKELANATMHLIQKNELLQEIKEELIDVRKKGDHSLSTKDFQNLMKLINDNMTVEDDKNLFEASFNEVHEKFIVKLKNDFPELSAADLKLAAYLKMNLTSKEIAPLFNISIRGLENKRYRLRKKLHLPNDANLLDFFIGYS